MTTTTRVQDDLRRIAEELIDESADPVVVGRIFAIASEIDEAAQAAHQASRRPTGYQRSLASGHGGAGITWNG